MIAVRYVALAALAVWLGSMSMLALLVAPAFVPALSSADLAVGAPAFANAGEILRLFHFLAYGCGALMLVCLFVIKFVGPPPRAFKLRASIVALMLGVAAYSGIPLSREIRERQSRVAGPASASRETGAPEADLNGLRRTRRVLMGVNMMLGLILLSWYVRE